MVKFTQSAPQTQGPSSGIGVQRFFDTDEGGPKLTPAMVFGFAIVVIVVFISLHAFNVFG
jgi:preprotein translocase subunit Sec61beta